ncbi:MAG: PAS domain S-box protein, partial [Gammaproteobacteria bacterium]|nr:PAS domain S-box protein [Gammaproteobacteria bacterium]
MVKEDSSRQISCVHLRWIIDLCQEKKVHLEKLARGSSNSLEYLTNERQQMSWVEFTDIISSLSKFFDEVDMRQAGRDSWRLAPLSSHVSIGQILFNIRDQYFAIYGAAGYCCRNFPIESEIEQLSRNRMTIRLTMKDGARSSYSFFTILAGQMEGLTRSMGVRQASVTMKPISQGASYTVEYRNQGLLFSPLRRIFHWLAASRQVTSEFTTLRENYEVLLAEHSEAAAERHQAQLAVVAHEESNRLMGSNIQDVIWTMNAALQPGIVSPSIKSILGYDEEEFRTMPPRSLFSKEDYETFFGTCRNVLNADHNQPVSMETKLIDAKGHAIWFELKLLPHHKPGSLICIARDVSQAKLIEAELINRTTNYRIVTDSAMDGIISFRTDNRITYVNPAATEIFGYSHSELIGSNIREVMPEALGDIRLRDLYGTASKVSVAKITLKGLRRDKSLVPLEVSFASHEQDGHSLITCIIRDISGRTQVERERESLQTQLEAAQKMDSIGQLSGGIAHDFNNLLVAILGYTDLALQSGTRESIKTYLEEIRKAGERGTDMTQKLLAFSRRQIIEPRQINANDLIDGVREMLSRLLPRNIQIIFAGEAEGVNFMADITQLEQVLINLAVNARDAMPGGGTLRISLSAGELESLEGNHLILEVADTGVGMDVEVRNRIFEPFYTTKPEGRGTGLGLAVVFGIVNQHKGFIQVDSTLGLGTTFRIYLPIATGDTDHPSNTMDTAALGGDETILIVEDNEQVRNLAKLILVGAGYNVLEAIDGRVGLDLFRQHSPSIDLVLMDVVMPELG